MCDLLKKLQRKHNACAYALVCLKRVRESKLNTNIHSNLTQDKASIKHKHLAGAAQKKEEWRERRKEIKEKLQASMKQIFGTLQKGYMTFISKR